MKLSLDIDQDLSSVQARLQVFKEHVAELAGNPPDDSRIYGMMDTDLELAMNETNEAEGSEAVIRPLAYDAVWEGDDEAEWESTDDEGVR